MKAGAPLGVRVGMGVERPSHLNFVPSAQPNCHVIRLTTNLRRSVKLNNLRRGISGENLRPSVDRFTERDEGGVEGGRRCKGTRFVISASILHLRHPLESFAGFAFRSVQF